MLKWILHRMLGHFEQAYDYDAGYMHEVIGISTSAGLRYFGLPMLSQMRGPEPELWAGAALASVLDGDCGSCAQLIVDLAVESGVDPNLLKACVAGDFGSAGAAGLGYRFACAAIGDEQDLEKLSDEIVSNHGKKALVSAVYAAASCRAYPVLKRGLGHGSACTQLNLGGEHVFVRPLKTELLKA